MPNNQQPIPLGLIAIKPYLDNFIDTVVFSETEVGTFEYQNNDFFNPPSVFIDGILLTYGVVSDRRYVSFDGVAKKLYLHNGGVNEGENVQIFL
jgi:predicted thioredoxin/glutaredoxin